MSKHCYSLFLITMILLVSLAGCDGSAPEAPSTVPEASIETTAPLIGETTAPLIGETTAPVIEETTAPTAESAQPSEGTLSEILPYLEQIPRADQSIFDGPGYDYSFVGTVEIAGTYTIVEEAWDNEGNLWGKLKSGAGWVDLTDIRSPDHASVPVSANYADDHLLQSGNYHHGIADTSEYMVQVAFRTQQTVTNVQLISLTLTGEGYSPYAVEYTLPELTPDKPLVADVAFPGDFSAYWLCFTDCGGTEHCCLLSMSLRNNSLIFEPYVPW